MSRRPLALLDRLLQLPLPWDVPPPAPAGGGRSVAIDGREFPIEVRRHRWARRYLVRLTEDGRVALTVPRGASIAGGLAFVAAESSWIAREWRRLGQRLTWQAGTEVWWRGARVALAVSREPGVVRPAAVVTCGELAVPLDEGDVRTTLQRHWRSLAEAELPPRCLALADCHNLRPARVGVRDQRSRWGACSARRAITLNWRLIQMPPFVADYVILHELAHLEHPNHGRRFWRKVGAICGQWREAERWLRKHGRELL